MTQRIALTHRIHHRFDRRVQLSTHWLRVRPAPHFKGIEAYSLRVEAEPHFLNWLRDPYENHLARLDLPEPVFALGLNLEIVARLDATNPFDFLMEPYAASYPFEYPEQLRKELAPYLRIDRPGPRFSDWLSGLDRKGKYIVDKLGEITGQVCQRIPTTGSSGPGWVDLEALLQRGCGSPWETAWLLTLSLRGMGLAARFTSGYWVRLSASETVADTVSTHAWSEVFLPGAGWIGLDPASGLCTAEGYIPLASAPDPLRTIPASGYHEACREERSEAIALRRLVPVTPAWPYGESVWADIRALGTRIDADLAARDVKLSLGTGLSFVSVENSGTAEWTTAALGPDKRQVAERLLAAMGSRLCSGGIFQVGQGDWYGGEELPRWRLGCFQRSDGRPIWRNPELLGWRRRRPMIVRSDDVRVFAETLARGLRISPSFFIAAHEDGLHQLWTSQMSVDWLPTPEELREPEQRRAVATCLSARHGEPAGLVLPLRWDSVRQRWASGVWSFRRRGLFLIPGKSALGFRLPIESLPVGEAGVADNEHERCQTEERSVLPEVCGELSARYTTLGTTGDVVEEADSLAPASRPPRTALALEMRDGQLYVFLPPLTHLEHYLDLVGAVEAAALQTGIPVVLEGYEPPEDHRLRRLLLEPEPGVLKVWLPDVRSWTSQQDVMAAAYEEAARFGLRAERITGAGQRLPPGGGAELVLGGENPIESPFLRRPELLRSLIIYWQRHPSLSYLFAGRLVGPDGPAPRPDEGRDDALYELTLALDRIPKGDDVRPWVPDRLLRHLLADPAGNMQRAEIRMDLLYAPDRPSQRLGKMMLRAFEALPDARLAAVQSLVVIGIVAALARQPGQAQPVEWGTLLHDRFMLPRVLWDDFGAVLGDLAEAGYPLQTEWFEPILDLRFPILGHIQLGDITLELRKAHEPWPLLAEEAAGAGMVRFLDSANERLQIRFAGLAPARFTVTCNGFHVPLRETGIRGEYVAGVRYKVWNPPSTLHPTVLPVHSLVIDLIDTWTGKVVGGCTYFPPRPGAWGPVGLPAAVPDRFREQMRKPDVQRLPTVNIPPWSAGGKFLPHGESPTTPAPEPAEVPSPGHPYLLDLTRVV